MGTNRGRKFLQKISFLSAPFSLTEEQVHCLYDQALKMMLESLSSIEFTSEAMFVYMEYLPVGNLIRPKKWAQALTAKIRVAQVTGIFEFIVFTTEYDKVSDKLEGEPAIPRIIRLN